MFRRPSQSRGSFDYTSTDCSPGLTRNASSMDSQQPNRDSCYSKLSRIDKLQYLYLQQEALSDRFESRLDFYFRFLLQGRAEKQSNGRRSCYCADCDFKLGTLNKSLNQLINRIDELERLLLLSQNEKSSRSVN